MFIVWQLKKNQERFYLISRNDDLGGFHDVEVEGKWVAHSFELAQNILEKEQRGQDATRTQESCQ